MHPLRCLVDGCFVCVLLLATALATAQQVPQTLEPYPLPKETEQSLVNLASDTDVLILGETHGTQEVPQIAAALLAPLSKQGYGILALEIPADEQQPLIDWAAGKRTQVPSFFTKQFKFEDGRANVQILALIRTALAPPSEWKLICFDQSWSAFASSPPLPEEANDPFAIAVRRDAHMAATLDKQRAQIASNPKVLAICGNFHARTANDAKPDDPLSKLWPSFAAGLQKDQPAWRINSINIVPHGGTYFATVDTGDGKPPRTGVHPIRSQQKVSEAEAHRLEAAAWNWELNLPKATAATFLADPAAAEPKKLPAPKSPKPQDPELSDELRGRTQKDQAARHAWIEWTKQHNANAAGQALNPEQKAEQEKILTELRKVDEANTEWLKQIVTRHGWPTITLVGQDGASAAWLLVQHADRDPKFQRTCLDLMTALPKEEVSQTDLAYLTDRVLLKEVKKQLYGTQFTSENGQWKPKPLEDEPNVDARRASIGLPPLAEYAKQLADVYGHSPPK